MQNVKTWCSLICLGAFVAAVAHAAPAWIVESNAAAQPLLQVMGEFRPEQASGYGLRQYDTLVADVGPGSDRRCEQALNQARLTLAGSLAHASDRHVRQDIEIMLHAADLDLEGIRLSRKYELPFLFVGRFIFQGEFQLLNPEAAPERHAAALERLRRYAGLVPGTKPLTELVRARCEEQLTNTALVGPYRGEVEQELANSGRYISGLKQLFVRNHLAGADEALAAIEKQLAEYDRWVREKILPHSRADFRQPPELYAYSLRRVGLDITPDELIAKANFEFSSVMAALQSLAPIVAKAHGWPETDYRQVVRRLKADQMQPAQVETTFRDDVIPALEKIIREQRIVTLPERAMAMRIGSEAENAIQPAPHMQPPPLVNNHGERGTFVLPLGNPPSSGGRGEVYDDFTFPAASWTLTAHEGRPGHELQFDRMVETGISYARGIFAFNSVNVEGWGLYCESEMQPYEPIDAQLIVLQLRLLRAVRAFSDPMLNLGRMTREQAHDLLVNDVCLSEAFAREEVDRFTFRSPGQATSYFYGFTRLMALKAATQVALGEKFDRMAFNDFVVDQGLLPPALLAEAVMTEFVSARRQAP